MHNASVPGVFLNCPSRASKLVFTVAGELVLDDLWDGGPEKYKCLI